jgi:hypothetical protein
MGDRAEELGDGSAHPLGGGIRGDQLGMVGLQALQLAEKLVVLGVGNLRLVEHVITVGMVTYQLPELIDTPCRIHGDA